MSLESLREALLRSLETTLAQLEPAAAENLQQYIVDLRGAAAARLWQPFCLITGQLVEGLVTYRLVRLSPPADISRVRGLGDLLDLARRTGVLAGESHRASMAALTSAQVVRNWSAHYALTMRRATERRATQSLALLLCAAELLFPTPLRREEPDDPQRALLRAALEPGSEMLRDATPDGILQLCAYTATLGLSKVRDLDRVLRKLELPTTIFAVALEREFPQLVRRTTRVNSAVIEIVVQVLKRAGLRDAASVFAALLPITPEAVIRLILNKSPAAVAIYLKESYEADKDLFRWKLGRMTTSRSVTDAFWNRMMTKNVPVTNIAGIVALLPKRVRNEFLERMPIALLNRWFEVSNLAAAISAVRIFREKAIKSSPTLLIKRDALIAQAVNAIAAADLRSLEGIPRLVNVTSLDRDPLGIAFIRAVVSRIQANLESEWDTAPDSIRRILCDSYMFFDLAEADTLSAAQQVIKTQRSHEWQIHCLAGLVAFAERATQDRGSIAVTLDSLIPPDDVDRWSCRFALFAATNAYNLPLRDIPKTLLAGARLMEPLLRETTRKSIALYEILRGMFLGGA
jgi:hypothetical protein